MSWSKTSENTKSSCSSCTSAIPQRNPAIEGDLPQSGQYKEFSFKFQSELFAQRVPSNGSLELTENCNFRCLHCYQGKNKHKEMIGFEQWAKIMDEIADAGCLWLLLTGGEPLLHPEFEKIYEYAIRKGFLVTVFTNGRLIKEKHIELFRRLPPFGIEVTFYGMSEEMYRKTTGTKNSFDKVVENCRKLKAANLPLKMKSVAFKPLNQDIPAIKKFIEEDLGVEFKFDTKVDPTIYGDQLDEIRMSPEEAVDLEDQIVGARPIEQDLRAMQKIRTQQPKSPFLYNCGAGKKSFYIDYKGWLHTCSVDRLEKEKFDLTAQSFSDIWYNEIPKVIFSSARQRNEICDSCEFRSVCDVCPATAKLSTGTKGGRPMYICQHTMERKQRFLGRTQQMNSSQNSTSKSENFNSSIQE